MTQMGGLDYLHFGSCRGEFNLRCSVAQQKIFCVIFVRCAFVGMFVIGLRLVLGLGPVLSKTQTCRLFSVILCWWLSDHGFQHSARYIRGARTVFAMRPSYSSSTNYMGSTTINGAPVERGVVPSGLTEHVSAYWVDGS